MKLDLPTRPRSLPATMPARPAAGAWGHEPHVDDTDELMFAPLGHAVIWAEDRTFHLCRNVALWIPAGVVHSARYDDDSLVVRLPFDQQVHGTPFRQPTEIVLTTRRAQLLLAHMRGQPEQPPSRELFDVLVSGVEQLPLPEPTSRIPRSVAGAMLADPADQRTVTEWADAHYTSATSLRRAFLAETGLTFSEWRTRARINASVELLARGRMVSTVAQQVGFTSTNGFILAFRRYFAQTPKAYALRRLCA